MSETKIYKAGEPEAPPGYESNTSKTDVKKFLDYEGVKHLWSKISMEDYPNNQTLMSVIEAIDETKADKNDLIEIGIVVDELISEKIYKQDEEPEDAEIGALWIDTDEKSSASGSGLPDIEKAQEGSFLRIVNGEPVWSAISHAEEATF